MLRKWGMLVLALLVTPMIALAQNTGKVSGVVTDAENGDPLPGASIALLGTQLGSISDVDGKYFIIGVPVGSYDVQASFVGYGIQTVSGVEVSSGYTREINFVLAPGLELGEIVVEYERPLIQRDAVGVPKIVTGEDLVNLPVRGATAVAAIQAGVVNKEGSGELNVRGGRGEEVSYYIDGVKVIGSANLPQSAVQEQEMVIGNISAKYGDAMSGIINITTKSGATRFFGSFEGITSQVLDPYGYNLLSGAIGGPVAGKKINFFSAVEYTKMDDRDPRAFGVISLPDAILEDLEAFPTALEALVGGESVFMKLPVGMANGSRLLIDDHGVPIRTDDQGVPLADQTAGGNLFFYTCTGTPAEQQACAAPVRQAAVAIPDGVDLASMSLRTVTRSEFDVNPDEFTIEKAKKNREFERASFAGSLVFNVLEDARLRVGGRYLTSNQINDQGWRSEPFATKFPGKSNSKDMQAYATWTHYLSSSSFFQLQGDYSRRFAESWDPRFGKEEADWFAYGDIQNPEWSTLAGTYTASLPTDSDNNTQQLINGQLMKVPVYGSPYGDNNGPSVGEVALLNFTTGGRFQNNYNKSEDANLRISANATTQVGLHQLEFGGEFEQRTYRAWGVNALNLSRIYDDRAQGSRIENVSNGIRDRNGDGIGDTLFVSSWDDIVSDPWVLNKYAGGYGYDLSGRNKVETQDLAKYLDQWQGKAASDYDRAPFKPIYYGGYVQDKIEFRDIVLNLGMRVDVFDNNQWVVKDPYNRRPTCLAGQLGGPDVVISLPTSDPTPNSPNFVETTTDCGDVPLLDGQTTATLPSNIDSDFTVFYAGQGVLGYRSTNGVFYTQNGQPVQAGSILLNGSPRTTYNNVTADMFEDYKPQVSVMPRIGVSFPVTDQALFFARYGTISQRPSGALASLATLVGTGGVPSDLVPQKTTEYEIGFRQRVGPKAAFTASGFYRQIENLIQNRRINGATPSSYGNLQNVDFGTVKGVEFAIDIRRTGGVAANVNYTLSFADGTGSGSGTTNTITWVDETPPNFISALDFDQRHRFNINIDYRLGKGEGPIVFGVKVLENFGANLLLTGGSGYPYTPVIEPFSQAGAARATQPKGGINSARMPSTSRVDLKVDRKIPLTGRATLTASLWVQNLFDQVNVNNVWRFTGLPDDDGYLATAGGDLFLADQGPVAYDMYTSRLRVLGNVGIPRMTRFGLRLDF